MHPVIKTGWPPPALLQDDCRKLFCWFASRPDARRLVREVAYQISQSKEFPNDQAQSIPSCQDLLGS